MKTLIVKYLPRGARSHSAELLECFLATAEPREVETLDLVEETPDLFDNDNLQAYIDRDYLGQELDPAARERMARMDRMTRQVLDADLVVLVTPMFNFSLPAAVKGWFDSVMLKGHTWDADENGFKGLMAGRKALSLSACGGVYEGEMAGYDHLRPLVRTNFGFMGFDTVETVLAQGMNVGEEQAEKGLAAAREEIQRLAGAWFPRS